MNFTNIKKNCLYYYEQFYFFLKYIAAHPFSGLFLLAGILISWIPYAFADDYYVDSEIIINLPKTNYNWLEIGRYGLVFTRRLLGTNWYNPYYTGILMLFFLWLSGMTLSYLCSKLFPKLPTAVTVLGSLVFLTYPTFTEQYYFQFQAAEVTFGLWLSIVAAGLFRTYVKDGRISCFIWTVPVYVLTFSIYQSFIPLTLCCYLGIFLSLSMSEALSPRVLRRSILGSMLHFVLSFVISQAIGRICFPSSGYLSNQVIWTAEDTSPFLAFKTIAGTAARMLVGHGLFYTAILLLAMILAVSGCIFLYKKACLPPLQLMLMTLSAIGIAITPFILTILMGANTSVRTQFTYPLAAIFLLYFGFQTLFYEKKDGSAQRTGIKNYPKAFATALRLLPATLLLVAACSQIFTVRLIWNAHDYVATFDRQKATEIISVLYDEPAMCDKWGTMLWGYLQPDTPYEDILANSHSSLFLSVFNLEYDEEPLCYYSTVRILGYMDSIGHDFVLPTHQTQNLAQYLMREETPDVYPAEDCTRSVNYTFLLNLGGLD